MELICYRYEANKAIEYSENRAAGSAYATLRCALLFSGDTAGAIKNLREGIDDCRALINLGYALHETDSSESKALFEKARSLEPGNVEAIGNLANCEAEAGNFPRAVELLREAIKLSPKDARFRENLRIFEEAFRNRRQ